jgi:hypothetical protein
VFAPPDRAGVGSVVVIDRCKQIIGIHPFHRWEFSTGQIVCV